MYWIATSPRLSRGRSTPAMRAIAAPFPLPLTLLVAGILADDVHAPRPPYHLAVFAPHLHRRSHLHDASFLCSLLEAIRDASPRQVIGRELHLDLVPGKDPDEVYPHLARHVGEHLVAVVELHAEHGVGKRLHHRALDFDRVFFGHRVRPPA